MPDRRWMPITRDMIEATGPEAAAFLQGQLSQDIGAIPVGGHAWSWILAPNGKVDALLRVVCRDPGDFLLDTDAGWGEAVLARLSRFRLRTKVELNLLPATVIGLRGRGWDLASEEVAGLGADIVVAPPWRSLDGADLILIGRHFDEVATGRLGPPLEPAEQEAERILAGIPRMGAELTDRTIPAETGLIDMTVSFTKGCYTGQELVARVDSRGGHVPRHLRALRLDGPAEPGTELHDEGGSVVGTLTSTASSGRGWVGLGYVKRGVEPPAVLHTGTGARVEVPSPGK